MTGIVRSALGAALLWGSAAAGGFALAWTVRAHAVGHELQGVAGTAVRRGRGFDAESTCRAPEPRPGQVAGLLEIPSLGLRAPVEQGEGDGVLSAAVGHDPSSVWPGADGTAVFAAHDVSYFARIDLLRQGAVIRFVSACTTTTFSVTGHRVVQAGSPVADGTRPTLLLDTCWPTNALWWTPDRLLVSAVETRSVPTAPAGGAHQLPTPTSSAPLAVPAPEALVAQGLTLDTNPTLLGTLSVVGRASGGLVESPAPLAAEEAALTAYYGGLHSIEAGSRAWWSAIAPHVPFPAAWSGSAVTRYVTRLGISVSARGSQVVGAALGATLELRSAAGAVDTVHLAVTTVVRGGTLEISKWTISS